MSTEFLNNIHLNDYKSNDCLLQCLSPILHSDSADDTAANICSCADTRARLQLTLHHPHPKWSSHCWSSLSLLSSLSSSSSCLPPVLTPVERANIESDEPGVCSDQVIRILRRLVTSNQEMKESVAVLLSGHLMDQCDNMTQCQACMVR